MKKHRNLPFFVPFAGCPFRCKFCSQEKITGCEGTAEAVSAELASFDSMMLHAGDLSKTENQIAFFGGSFTGIPRARMIPLLERAQTYIERGDASSIRISTRPDMIDDDVLELLARYRVTDVELGVQSMDDEVLRLSGRGHTAEDSRIAAKLLQKHGLRFTGQMMLGLPGSDESKELATAREICTMGAVSARIYPTVVFEGTELYSMTVRGEYIPLDDLSAAKRTVPCLETFLSAGVRVLKIGLQASKELSNAPFGPRDGSLAELAYGLLYVKRIKEQVSNNVAGKVLNVFLPRGEISKFTGHKGVVLQELKKTLLPACINLREDGSLSVPNAKIQIEG